jgi:tRNA A37 threonylcarbamoyladenosine synthetase subunit TsaC/SUA5/YrdC
VLPRTPRSERWDLGADVASIGVRVPAHPLALALLAAAGPLAVTSANRSGRPPATTCDELVEAFGDDVAVYLCEDEPRTGSASTVVSLLGPTLEVLRAGAMDERTLERLSTA